MSPCFEELVATKYAIQNQMHKHAGRALSSLITSTLILEAMWSLLIDGTIITDIQSNRIAQTA
jgi:hypothetical protein